MEKTLQEQYNLIKEGKGNKAYFLKSAFRLFPDMLSPVNTFEDTVTILKNRSIISEGIGGLVTSGKKQDWHSIFKENIDKIKEDDIQNKENIKKAVEYYNQNAGRISMKDAASKFNVAEFDVISALNQGAISGIRFENINEAKEKEEPSKEVLDNQKHNFDYKDEKNYDNLFGEEFLKGYYTELKNPSKADKDVDELRAIVAKNLAKDHQYYVKNGQFGVKGLGYTTEAPGLGEPKEPKGKFKSSGYGDLKESVLRSQIHLLIKEVLSETPPLKAGEMGTYEGKPVFIIAVSMHAKTDKDESQPFSYTIKTEDGKIYKEVPISAVKPSLSETKDKDKDKEKEEAKKKKEELKKLDKEWKKKLKTGDVDSVDETKKPVSEALDMDSIKNEGEDAKKKVMERRITNEIVKRKKQIKALETLTELEGNEDNIKKVKELQSEIKKLEGAKAKLNGKKKKEKEVDEMILQNTKTKATVVATNPQSIATLKGAGFQPRPGSEDVTPAGK